MFLKIHVTFVCVAIAAVLAHPYSHHDDHRHHSDDDAHYEFSYAVHDPHTADIKSQQESRHGDAVQGRYELIDSDGFKRIVEYTADDQNGFNAVVKRVPTDIQVPVPDAQPQHQHQHYHQHQPMYQPQPHYSHHQSSASHQSAPMNYHAHSSFAGGAHNMNYMHRNLQAHQVQHHHQPLYTGVHLRPVVATTGGHHFSPDASHVRVNAPGITSYQY